MREGGGGEGMAASFISSTVLSLVNLALFRNYGVI